MICYKEYGDLPSKLYNANVSFGVMWSVLKHFNYCKMLKTDLHFVYFQNGSESRPNFPKASISGEK